MRFLSKLFASKEPPPKSAAEHAVIVRFGYGSCDLARLIELEDRLREAIDTAGVGEYDGNDLAADGSDGTVYMYGPSADSIFETVLPVLRSTEFMRGAEATLRYGSPVDGVSEVTRSIDG